MIDTRAMYDDAKREKLHAYSCLSAVAASLPEGCELRRAYDTFTRLPLWQRHRALRSPRAAARLTAMRLKAGKPAPGAPAWGVVEGREGMPCFAVFTGSVWLARSPEGVAHVHPSRVLNAWGVV